MSIRMKLMLSFMLTIIPIIFLIHWGSSKSEEVIEQSVIDRLSTIAQLNAQKIDRFFSDLSQDMNAAQGYHNIQHNLPILLDEKSVREEMIDNQNNRNKQQQLAFNTLNKQLSNWVNENNRINDVKLLDINDQILYSTQAHNRRHQIGHTLASITEGETLESYRLNLHHNEKQLTKLTQSKHNDNFAMFMIDDAHDSDGNVIGKIALEINVDNIFELINSKVGLGRTGETILGRKEADHALFVSPLTHDQSAILTKKALFSTDQAQPIKEAVTGKSGKGYSVDYRGEKIFAVWQPLKNVNWGMVSKIDTSECFANIRQHRQVTHMTILWVILVFLFAGYVIGNSISYPIKKLNRQVKSIMSDDLDQSSLQEGHDEISTFSKSFDSMRLALKETREGLEETVTQRTESLQQFTNIAAHDLNIPIGNINVIAELIRERYLKGGLQDNDPEVVENLDMLINTSVNMRKLVNDLLEYSKLGRNKEPRFNIDLNDFLDTLIFDNKVYLEQNDAQIHFNDLHHVHCGETSLKQIFLNLINNAVKYRSTENPQIHIFSTEIENDMIQVTVKDNGLGIDPKFHTRIFNAFDRGSIGRQFEGSGVGLATVKKLVELMRGRVWVNSQANEGSSFHFTLPKKKSF